MTDVESAPDIPLTPLNPVTAEQAIGPTEVKEPEPKKKVISSFAPVTSHNISSTNGWNDTGAWMSQYAHGFTMCPTSQGANPDGLQMREFGFRTDVKFRRNDKMFGPFSFVETPLNEYEIPIVGHHWFYEDGTELPTDEQLDGGIDSNPRGKISKEKPPFFIRPWVRIPFCSPPYEPPPFPPIDGTPPIRPPGTPVPVKEPPQIFVAHDAAFGSGGGGAGAAESIPTMPFQASLAAAGYTLAFVSGGQVVGNDVLLDAAPQYRNVTHPPFVSMPVVSFIPKGKDVFHYRPRWFKLLHPVASCLRGPLLKFSYGQMSEDCWKKTAQTVLMQLAESVNLAELYTFLHDCSRSDGEIVGSDSDASDVLKKNWGRPNPVRSSRVKFTAAIQVAIKHCYGTFPFVQCIDSAGSVFLPSTITHSTDENTVTVTFSSPQDGTIILIAAEPNKIAATVTHAGGGVERI